MPAFVLVLVLGVGEAEADPLPSELGEFEPVVVILTWKGAKEVFFFVRGIKTSSSDQSWPASWKGFGFL